MGLVVSVVMITVGLLLRFGTAGGDLHLAGLALVLFGVLGAVDRVLREVGRSIHRRHQHVVHAPR